MGTNQLLEIMHRERQQEDSTATAVIGTDLRSTTESRTGQPSGGKRKRRGVVPKVG